MLVSLNKWLVLGGLLAGLAACSADEQSQPPAPGGTADDAGTGGTGGGSAGSGGAEGGAAGQGPAGAAGDGGSGGGTLPPDATLGAKCEGDADCTSGRCLLPTDDLLYGGGPANGYCTRDCGGWDGKGADPCTDLGPDAQCFDFGDGSFCLQGCIRGPEDLDTFDANKCHGRKDVGCTQIADDSGSPVGMPACMPLCGKNADCGTPVDRLCDPAFGVCVAADKVSTGEPLGSYCGGGGADCEGVCLNLNNTTSWCTQACVVGNYRGSCGYGGIPAVGLCLLQPVGAGFGDVGFCTQLCSVDSDCRANAGGDMNTYCELDPAFVEDVGRGYCWFREWDGGVPEAGVDAQPDAEAGPDADAQADAPIDAQDSSAD